MRYDWKTYLNKLDDRMIEGVMNRLTLNRVQSAWVWVHCIYFVWNQNKDKKRMHRNRE